MKTIYKYPLAIAAFPVPNGTYIGTVQVEGYVWHYYRQYGREQ